MFSLCQTLVIKCWLQVLEISRFVFILYHSKIQSRHLNAMQPESNVLQQVPTPHIWFGVPQKIAQLGKGFFQDYFPPCIYWCFLLLRVSHLQIFSMFPNRHCFFLTYRQFDLRESHICHSNENCKNTLIDLTLHVGPCEVKCIEVNPCQSELLAIGCSDPYVRMYDRRMLAKHCTASAVTHCCTQTCPSATASLPSGCAQYFTPGHLLPLPGVFWISRNVQMISGLLELVVRLLASWQLVTKLVNNCEQALRTHFVRFLRVYIVHTK